MKCLPFTLALSLLCIDLGAQSNFTALKVSDKTEYVSTSFNPNFGEDQDFSIEFKVRTNGWTSDPSLVSDKDWESGNNTGFNIALGTGGSSIDVNVGDGTRRADLLGGTIVTDQWHHVLAVFDRDASLSMYIDGIFVQQEDMSTINNINSPYNLNIGQDGTGSYGSGTTAEISDVRIWNRVIATNEVSYCRSDLLANWKLDEIKMIEGLLFISMLPLHSDNLERQLALFCVGIERLNEIFGV